MPAKDTKVVDSTEPTQEATVEATTQEVVEPTAEVDAPAINVNTLLRKFDDLKDLTDAELDVISVKFCPTRDKLVTVAKSNILDAYDENGQVKLDFICENANGQLHEFKRVQRLDDSLIAMANREENRFHFVKPVAAAVEA